MVRTIKSQWEIDPKVYIQPDYKSEYASNVADKAPPFVYRRTRAPDKYGSQFKLVDGPQPFMPSEVFKTIHRQDYLRENISSMPAGYEKRQSFKVKEVQVDVGSGKLEQTCPVSHETHRELDMKLANVRNLRDDGIRPAGRSRAAATTIPSYNAIPGVGGDIVPRYVFDAYEEKTNKYRDTRKFAKMNNPVIPRGHTLNPLTGEVLAIPMPPRAELNPRPPQRPPLNTLAQVRPPS